MLAGYNASSTTRLVFTRLHLRIVVVRSGHGSSPIHLEHPESGQGEPTALLSRAQHATQRRFRRRRRRLRGGLSLSRNSHRLRAAVQLRSRFHVAAGLRSRIEHARDRRRRQRLDLSRSRSATLVDARQPFAHRFRIGVFGVEEFPSLCARLAALTRHQSKRRIVVVVATSPIDYDSTTTARWRSVLLLASMNRRTETYVAKLLEAFVYHGNWTKAIDIVDSSIGFHNDGTTSKPLDVFVAGLVNKANAVDCWR